MLGLLRTNTENSNRETSGSKEFWLKWCRLCAKENPKDKQNLEIFKKTESGTSDTTLATSIGKYFWVNIKPEDQISTNLCMECHQLIDELITFTDRVNKVQTLFCLYQNLMPTTALQANKMKAQCGLIDAKWKHIIRQPPQPQPAVKIPKKPVQKTQAVQTYLPPTTNQEVQTDLVIFFNREQTRRSSNDEETKLCLKENTEEQQEEEEVEEHVVLSLADAKIFENITKQLNEEDGQQLEEYTDGDGESYEYIIHDDNNEIILENIKKSSNTDVLTAHEDAAAADGPSQCKKRKIILIEDEVVPNEPQENVQLEEEEEDEEEESDLMQELKFKTEYKNRRNSTVKKEMNHIADNQLEYQAVSDILGELEDENSNDNEQEHAVKVHLKQNVQNDDDDDDEDEEDYVLTNVESDNTLYLNPYDFLAYKKRGRPLNSNRNEAAAYRFECKDCNRKYKNPNVYRKHMQTAHNLVIGQLAEFVCQECNKDCGTESRLKSHARMHLPVEEKHNIPCPYCERKFSQIGAMRQHVKGIHHQFKPFICDQCGRACKTLASLNEHLLVHTNDCPFECDVCKKKFKNKARLKSHMDTHTEEAYVCCDCGLNLNTKRTLLQHRLVHSDEKKFKCEFCDAAFKRSKALKNHLILHSGLRPYKCNFCDKSFSNGSNCRSHKKRAHAMELLEEERKGVKTQTTSIPKLEELKQAKNALVQPRKIKRPVAGLPDHLRKLLVAAENRKKRSTEDALDNSSNYDSVSVHYKITDPMSPNEAAEEIVQNAHEEIESETVIYEIIDEI